MTKESETEEIDTTIAPSWFQLDDPEERELWTTRGLWSVDPPQRGPYRLMTSEEQAILWARTNNVGYTWDGSNAFRTDVRTQLIEARHIGRPGVCVMTYADGKWIVLEHHSV